jgi:hypothetical protein
MVLGRSPQLSEGSILFTGLLLQLRDFKIKISLLIGISAKEDFRASNYTLFFSKMGSFLLLRGDFYKSSRQLGTGLARKYQTRVKVTDKKNHCR